jgi:hypothetical protein
MKVKFSLYLNDSVLLAVYVIIIKRRSLKMLAQKLNQTDQVSLDPDGWRSFASSSPLFVALLGCTLLHTRAHLDRE